MIHCQKILIVLYIIIVIEKLCTYMNAESNKIKSKSNQIQIILDQKIQINITIRRH